MLRKATFTDKALWVRLNREFMEFEITDNNLWNQIDQAKDEELAEVFSEALENPRHVTIFMIEDEGEVIGFANLITIFSVWSEGYALMIDDLYIRDDKRGRGIGRQVMKEIEDYAHKSGYRRLQFLSEESNPQAGAFYRKLGYKPVAMNFYARYL